MTKTLFLNDIHGQLLSFLSDMSVEDYTKPLNLLQGATVGKHVRHLIEAFETVANAVGQTQISFDHRKRNVQTETDPEYALTALAAAIAVLARADLAQKVCLESDFSLNQGDSILTDSSLQRELIYASEHAIHHLAIIKIALIHEMHCEVAHEIGIAPSTLRSAAINAAMNAAK